MSASVPQEPDQPRSIIYIGQDTAGHWLVQDSAKRLEGWFVSFDTAMSYARGVGDVYRARVEVASCPLSPLVAFTPIDASACALARAA